ncbi:2-oxoacid:acceptor oxidoreductase family protein [Phosphitispora fastidiosa]|uniref:2-oxoacid:acceptor oxidoreductase family protein n=1 Tax=Phosphitispora fastidiosa TaxID=2837202 RepID=UPI001E338390|nr:2-oxoacid:acceptor oxidoreductase family protein [Phosphitispora fastidiosa]MBU7006972.1 2-oxoglutarate ferredoxin oxidoreductase subunit gamma [Phosphitispora fastidiosa]
MRKIWNVIIAGSGGQGLGMAGRILAETALSAGMHAAHNQSYGARARGGYSQSSVVISSNEIVYPFVEQPNLVIALSQRAYDIYLPLMAPDGVMIFDSELVQGKETGLIRGFPFSDTSRRACSSLGISIAALGAAVRLTAIVPEDMLDQALNSHFQGETLAVNSSCLSLGMDLV